MKNLKAQNIKVIKNEEKPETPEVLAQAIIDIADGFNAMLNSRLTRRALVVLLQDMIGAGKVSRTDINLVLDNLPKLKSYYVKK